MRKLLPVLLGMLLICGFTPVVRSQDERIHRYISYIEVNTDGMVTVKEIIRVYAGGIRIKRGIFRKLPEIYLDRNNNRYRTKFQLLRIEKNGKPEPYHVAHEGIYQVVYAGDEDIFLEPGNYTYAFSYQVRRMIGFFKDYDELYWNVTGDQWEFSIDTAEAWVKLPPGSRVIQFSAYDGRHGSQTRNFAYDTLTPGYHHFLCTRPLAPNEGFTLAIAFPKGMVHQPGKGEILGMMLSDNLGISVAVLLFLLMLVYYIYAWFRVGRDPARGPVVVQYHPPASLSPGAMRYIYRMGFDIKCVTVNIIGLAVKGYVQIVREGDDYSVRKIASGNEALGEDEKALADSLFACGGTLKLINTNHQRIAKGSQSLRTDLRKKYQKTYFNLNTAWFFPGVLVTLTTILLLFFLGRESGTSYALSLGMMAFVMGGLWIAITGFKTLKNAGGQKKERARAGIMILGGVFFTIMTFSVFGANLYQINLLMVLVLMAQGVLVVLFYHLLKAPTPEGRKLMDQIEGFKEYLERAEKEELDNKNAPEKTPELFELFLPYAIALGVENRWGEKFASILQQASENNDYQPTWYVGHGFTALTIGSFGSSFSQSFSGAFSSASMAPGSTSGSGGGGSSGGGGGGGGGGGW